MGAVAELGGVGSFQSRLQLGLFQSPRAYRSLRTCSRILSSMAACSGSWGSARASKYVSWASKSSSAAEGESDEVGLHAAASPICPGHDTPRMRVGGSEAVQSCEFGERARPGQRLWQDRDPAWLLVRHLRAQTSCQGS